MSNFVFPTGRQIAWHPETGLTKRELFAAMAMQGQLACENTSGNQHEYAECSVEYADALLAALAKFPEVNP